MGPWTNAKSKDPQNGKYARDQEMNEKEEARRIKLPQNANNSDASLPITLTRKAT